MLHGDRGEGVRAAEQGCRVLETTGFFSSCLRPKPPPHPVPPSGRTAAYSVAGNGAAGGTARVTAHCRKASMSQGLTFVNPGGPSATRAQAL